MDRDLKTGLSSSDSREGYTRETRGKRAEPLELLWGVGMQAAGRSGNWHPQSHPQIAEHWAQRCPRNRPSQAPLRFREGQQLAIQEAPSSPQGHLTSLTHPSLAVAPTGHPVLLRKSHSLLLSWSKVAMKVPRPISGSLWRREPHIAALGDLPSIALPTTGCDLQPPNLWHLNPQDLPHAPREPSKQSSFHCPSEQGRPHS